MNTSEFHIDIPTELIAQTPLADRAASRLLVLNCKGGRPRSPAKIEHKNFSDIIDYLNPGDCLVMNDSRVIPARLIGEKVGRDDLGALIHNSKIEFLLLKRLAADIWEVILKPGKRAKVGSRFVFGAGDAAGGNKTVLSAEILSIAEDGKRIVKFEFEGIWEELLDRLGEMPLPPYIKQKLTDKERYQTVYSKAPGSAAAPTAGLHFTNEILDKIREKGVNTAFLTLHVGLGTFRPVSVQDVTKHIMHSEQFELSKETAEIINKTRANGGRIIAVGTTSVRVLESCADDGGTVTAQSGETDIFIYPPYKFRAVDGMITNFHLSESTLLMLVSAFAGSSKNIFAAYNEAIAERYRFFSFGDAMLIV